MKVMMVDSGEIYLERTRTMGKPYPHSGIGYLATILVEEGHQVTIVDMAAQQLSRHDVADFIKKTHPHVVAISSMTYSILCAYSIAEAAKSAGCTVIAGGVHPTLLPENTLKECSSIDCIVCGEGEAALPALLAHLESDHIDTLPNVACRTGTQIKKNPVHYIQNLDDLPFPDWSLFDYSLYYRLPTDEGEIALYQINSSRGCPYACTFCSPLHGKKVRFRSAESLVQEMKLNHERFNARHFDFADSNATLHRKNFMAMCTLLSKEGLSDEVGWSIDTHVNHVDKALLEQAVKAGLKFMSIGVESGDQTLLYHIGKKITLSAIERTIKTATDLGISVKCSLLLGHPYETLETAKKTFEFALYLRKKYGIEYYYNLVDVYPGTHLYSMVERGEGGARWISGKRNNWAAYRRDEPMIEVNDLTEEVLQNLYRQYTQALDEQRGSSFYEGGE